jgi:hypothetical protein
MSVKHIIQMTQEEKAFTHGFIRKNADKVMQNGAHGYNRAAERDFNLDDIRAAVRTGTVIELHNEAKEWRALARDRKGTCVVISLESWDTVTVFYNDPSDNHDTLNHNRYHSGKAIDAVATIKSLLRKQ